MRIFEDFGDISCLRLNLPKTVLIPLWPAVPRQLKRALYDDFPAWANVGISFSAKYLGFYLGPEAGSQGWEQAIGKYSKRCELWCSLRLGMQYDARVYRIFCFSVLGFLWQLEQCPNSVLEAERIALRRFAPGPGNWVTPNDLFNLKASFGFPFAFQSAAMMALAAKLRVYKYECFKINDRASALQLDILVGPYRRPSWQAWYRKSMVLQVQSDLETAKKWGVAIDNVDKHINKQVPSADLRRRKHLSQRASYDVLLKVIGFDSEDQIMTKINRRKCPDPAGRVARRAENRLQSAFSLVSPRVAIVFFGTLWNRWCTARRFQEEGACIFGCPGEAQDSIEHYTRCPVQLHFARNVLHIPAEHTGIFNRFYSSTLTWTQSCRQ